MRPILVAIALLAAAMPASAGAPMPANSTLPTRIYIVGWNGVTPDAQFGQFQVTVRDLANNPVAGSTVTVDFAPISELRLASNQLSVAALTNCPHRFVKGTTDAAGTAAFTVMGRAGGFSTQAGVLYANILADGVLIGRVPVSIYDLDGANGLGANDISVWLDDFPAAQFRGRGDYDGNGYLGANDLSLWLDAMGAGGSSFSAASVCP